MATVQVVSEVRVIKRVADRREYCQCWAAYAIQSFDVDHGWHAVAL